MLRNHKKSKPNLMSPAFLLLTIATSAESQLKIPDPYGNGQYCDVLEPTSFSVIDYFQSTLSSGIDVNSDRIPIALQYIRHVPSTTPESYNLPADHPNFGLRIEDINYITKDRYTHESYSIPPITARLTNNQIKYLYQASLKADHEERIQALSYSYEKGRFQHRWYDKHNGNFLGFNEPYALGDYADALAFCFHGNQINACENALALTKNSIAKIDGSKAKAQAMKECVTNQKQLLEKTLFSEINKRNKQGQKAEVKAKKETLAPVVNWKCRKK